MKWIDDSIEVILYLQEYVQHFNEYYKLLLNRYERFKELRKKEGWTIDTETYFDMLIVQLRSMLIDNSKKGVTGNYTIQNIIGLESDTEAWSSIESMLNEVLISGEGVCDDCKVWYTIKIIADKSICHYDNYHRKGSHKWELIQSLKLMLFSEDERINIDYIIKTITNILHDGVSISFAE